MTSFNTKVFGKGLYRLEFETDNRENYLRMQKLARACVDQDEVCIAEDIGEEVCEDCMIRYSTEEDHG